MKKILMLGLAMTLLIANNVYAQSSSLVGVFKDWSVYSSFESGHKVCYMVTKPKNERNKKFGDAYAMITQRPSEGRLNEISVVSGYTYKKGSEVFVSFDKKTFKLFTDNDTAWANDSKMDNAITSFIKGASQMTVVGVNGKDEKIVDSYSLKGSTKAYYALNKACGL